MLAGFTALTVVALVFLHFATGSLLAWMGDSCGGIFAASRGFLSASRWNYLLASVIAGLFFAQLGFLLGGGTRLLKATHRAARFRNASRCPALAAISSRPQSAHIYLTDAAGLQACSAGLFRPRIMVSPALVELLDGAELRAVVAHEQAHCRWRDNLLVALAKPLSIMLFYLPGTRLTFRQMRISIEHAADRAAAGEADTLSVASALARIGLFGSKEGRMQGADGMAVSAAIAGAGDKEQALASRVKHLVNDEAPRPKVRRAILFTGALLAATTIFASSAMALADSDQHGAFICFTQHQDGGPGDPACDLDHSQAD